MKMFSIILVLILLSGCESTRPRPYIFGGAGYSAPSGYHGFNVEGVSVSYGTGIEFNHNIVCEARHRSMVANKPEVVTNDFNCEKRIYFGD